MYIYIYYIGHTYIFEYWIWFQLADPENARFLKVHIPVEDLWILSSQLGRESGRLWSWDSTHLIPQQEVKVAQNSTWLTTPKPEDLTPQLEAWNPKISVDLMYVILPDSPKYIKIPHQHDEKISTQVPSPSHQLCTYLPPVTRRRSCTALATGTWGKAMDLPNVEVEMARIPSNKMSHGKKENGLTPWKINMEHNHRGLEDHFPF